MFRRMWLAVLPVLAGCVGQEPTIPGVARSDSSGVEVIRVGRQVIDHLPDVAIRESVRIGTRDGDEATSFFRVAAIHVLPDGGLVVLDRGNGIVKLFDRGGSFVRTVGRPGDGPGEFARPYGISALADTLLVVDRLLHRFTLNGVHISSVRPPVPDGTYLWSVSATDGGWLGEVRAGSPPATGPEGWSRTPTEVVRFDRRSLQPQATIATVLGSRTYRLTSVRFTVAPLFEPEPTVALSPIGAWVVRDATYRLELIDPERGLSRVLVADVAPVPVDDAVSSYVAVEEERIRAMPGGPEREAYREAMLERRLDLPTPRARPVLGRVIPSRDGGLLVERLDLDASPFDLSDATHWDIIAPDGAPWGRLRLREGLVPMALDGSRVWGVEKDDLGVEYLVALDFFSERPTALN